MLQEVMVNVKTLWSEPIDLRKLLVEAVELSLVLLVFLAEELVRLAGSVEDGVPLAVGDGQLLLVTTILGLVPILGDGKSEVGQVLDQVLHTLVVRWSLLLPQLLHQLLHPRPVPLFGRLERLLDLLGEV